MPKTNLDIFKNIITHLENLPEDIQVKLEVIEAKGRDEYDRTIITLYFYSCLKEIVPVVKFLYDEFSEYKNIRNIHAPFIMGDGDVIPDNWSVELHSREETE